MHSVISITFFKQVDLVKWLWIANARHPYITRWNTLNYMQFANNMKCKLNDDQNVYIIANTIIDKVTNVTTISEIYRTV